MRSMIALMLLTALVTLSFGSALAQDAGNIEINFNNYLNGYSKNVRDIIENFKLEGTIARLMKNDLLFMLVDKFTEIEVGTIQVPKAGAQAVNMRPRDAQSWKAINLRWLKLSKSAP